MQTTAPQRDFFLCHAGKDKARVDEYNTRLVKLDATTAFDKYDIGVGQDWVDQILDLLPSSKVCVVFVSEHSSKALVQGKEAFLARYLARQFPDRHRVIPVYLKGAPPQTDLHGLQTTSGFREESQSVDAIAKGLMAELRGLGDAAHRATHAVEMIDEIALQWLFPKSHPFREQIRLRGDEMLLRRGEEEAAKISRDQFEAKLTKDELRVIEHMERKMESLYAKWEKSDFDPESHSAERNGEEFARLLGKEVVALLDLLDNSGFGLMDHYGHIRHVVATHYQSRA